MARFIYLESAELYNKLKSLLTAGVEFGSDIKNRHFCIYAKSKIIAIKLGYNWYINLDNWKVGKETLDKMGIQAITPGSYALKQLKESLKEHRVTYDFMWPKLKNEINKIIRSGYNPGTLYARPGFYKQKVYHYDINSAFAHGFKSTAVPIGVPKIYTKFIPPDEEHLNIYCMDMNVEYNSHDIFPYLINSSQLSSIPSEIISSTGFGSIYKVITQTEYMDVVRDYNVESKCLYTFQFKKRKGMFDSFIDKFFELKNTTYGEERNIYKSILASLAGKLSQAIEQQEVPKSVNEYGHIMYETLKIDLDDVQFNNPAVSVFIVDFVRKMIRDIIKNIGYQKVVLVDTDGFISLEKIDLELTNNLGGWKCQEYDNLIVNGPRSYFYTQNGDFHSSISGLGDIFDDGNTAYNYDSIRNLTKLKKAIPITKKVLYCGEPRFITMNVNVGGLKMK